MESAHAGELAGEHAASFLKRTKNRSQRSNVRASRQGYHKEEIHNSRLRFHGESEAKTSLPHKTKERQSFLNRFFQRKRYKDAYRAAKSGASAGKLGGAAAAGGVENMTVKAKIVMKDIIRREPCCIGGYGNLRTSFFIDRRSLWKLQRIRSGKRIRDRDYHLSKFR